MSQSTMEDIRKKYREERDKRLRADGLGQYIHLEGDLAKMAEDPWAPEKIVREPMQREVDAVLLGGGMASILVAVNLKKAGLKDLLFIDRASDFGGTWYWNRYPGAQCDTESYVYLPLLEETGYTPTEKYAHQPEILEHLQRIAKQYDLYENTAWQTEVHGAEWHDDRGRWLVRTDRGDEIWAKYFVVAPGRLQSPKLPGIPGVETFKGEAWHTSRWNPKYAGENLKNLADKRVGIIGTGATGLQVIPRVAAAAGEFFVFQRTPSGVWERRNKPTPEDFHKDHAPGWQRRRMRNFTAASAGAPTPDNEPDFVDDGWTEIAGILAEPGADPEQQNLKVMETLRSRIDATINDKNTAAALKPYYDYGCKRPTFHDEYLKAYNRPNVHLVDTDGKGPDKITERGVVVAGKEYELDCLIYASGFDLGMGFLYGTNMVIKGRDGQELAPKWSNGLRTLHGYVSAGFPNCFYLGFTQTAFSVSYAHMADEQAEHIGWVVEQAEKRGTVIEPTLEAETAYVDYVLSSRTPEALAAARECTPSSGNNEGDVESLNTLGAGQYLPGGNEFFDMLAEWRKEGKFAGLTMGE